MKKLFSHVFLIFSGTKKKKQYVQIFLKITCWIVCEALERLWRGPYSSSNGSSTISSFTAPLLSSEDDELDVVPRCPFSFPEFINSKSSLKIYKLKIKMIYFLLPFFLFLFLRLDAGNIEEMTMSEEKRWERVFNGVFDGQHVREPVWQVLGWWNYENWLPLEGCDQRWSC